MGIETPTNVPFWRAGPVDGTRLARIMPRAIERMIQITRKRSRKERALKGGALWSCGAELLLVSAILRSLRTALTACM